MKRFLLFVSLIAAVFVTQAQSLYTFPYDSVYFKKGVGNSELVLLNGTRSVKGFLFNRGDGRTEFRRPLTKLTDTSYLVGLDTLIIPKGIDSSLMASHYWVTTNFAALSHNHDSRYPLMSGHYINPSWIDSLQYSKLSGLPSTFSPSSGSGFYIQNGTASQNASFNITGPGNLDSNLVVGNAMVVPTINALRVNGGANFKGPITFNTYNGGSNLLLTGNSTGVWTFTNGSTSQFQMSGSQIEFTAPKIVIDGSAKLIDLSNGAYIRGGQGLTLKAGLANANKDMMFQIGTTEKMRLDTAGRLLVGYTGGTAQDHIAMFNGSILLAGKAVAPTSTIFGGLYANSTDNSFYGYTTSWKKFLQTGDAIHNQSTAKQTASAWIDNLNIGTDAYDGTFKASFSGGTRVLFVKPSTISSATNFVEFQTSGSATSFAITGAGVVNMANAQSVAIRNIYNIDPSRGQATFNNNANGNTSGLVQISGGSMGVNGAALSVRQLSDAFSQNIAEFRDSANNVVSYIKKGVLTIPTSTGMPSGTPNGGLTYNNSNNRIQAQINGITQTINTSIRATFTHDIPATTYGSPYGFMVTVTGAAYGDHVLVSCMNGLGSGELLTANVLGPDTVYIEYVQTKSGQTADPANQVYNITVIKF